MAKSIGWKPNNGLQKLADEWIQAGRQRLEQGNWLDEASGGPNLERLRSLIGQEGDRIPDVVRDVVRIAYLVGPALEIEANMTAAMAWYQVGQLNWVGGRQFTDVTEDPPSTMYRDAVASEQLIAAVCADRAGNSNRARDLYEWAAYNHTLTADEYAWFLSSKQLQVIWEWHPWRAYALACLGRWEEAFEIAEDSQQVIDKDRRRRGGTGEREPVKINPVVLALASYHIEPSNESHKAAQQALHANSVASGESASYLTSLFYLFNLRARFPDLAPPLA